MPPFGFGLSDGKDRDVVLSLDLKETSVDVTAAL